MIQTNELYDVIIVTGASSGIGKAIYDWLKSANRRTLGVSDSGPDWKIDLSKRIPSAPSWDIKMLINCAGIFTMPENHSRKVMDVNFWGTYNMIRTVLPLMSEGLIINIASVSGMKQEPDEPIYAASKAAVISLTKSLALKLAPKIRVNCISPGFYNTNLVPGDTPQHLIDTIPLGYEDEPEHILPVIKMIMDTPYLTGANIVVDGGLVL